MDAHADSYFKTLTPHRNTKRNRTHEHLVLSPSLHTFEDIPKARKSVVMQRLQNQYAMHNMCLCDFSKTIESLHKLIKKNANSTF